MALSANSVFEVRTAGSDTNGGGFVTGSSGTDFSKQNSKNSSGSNISTTDAVAAGTTTITSATAAFTSAIVGNIIYLAGGTGSLAAGWYQVATFVNATTITVDRTVATGTGITMNIGGAFLTPGAANAIAISGNIVFILNIGADGASVYSVTSATVSVAAGCFGGTQVVQYQGYTSNRSLGNIDARPQIQTNVSTATLVQTTGATFNNLVFNGNSQTAAKLCSAASDFVGCMFENFNTASSSSPRYYRCAATTNSASPFTGEIYYCEAYANTSTPFTSNAFYCIASGNTGASTDGFSGGFCIGCIAISNGRHGFNNSTAGQGWYINCHAESNSGYGFVVSVAGKVLINCSAFGNSSGATNITANVSNVGFITVTAGSVFVNAGSNNYLLNNTASQGALLRAAADPATFPRGLTNNFRDIGAAQHQDSPSTTNVFVIDD
jgi:hypothetical protein